MWHFPSRAQLGSPTSLDLEDFAVHVLLDDADFSLEREETNDVGSLGGGSTTRVVVIAHLTLAPGCAAGDVVAPAAAESLVEGGDAEVTHAAAVALRAGHRGEGGAVELEVHLRLRITSK